MDEGLFLAVACGLPGLGAAWRLPCSTCLGYRRGMSLRGLGEASPSSSSPPSLRARRHVVHPLQTPLPQLSIIYTAPRRLPGGQGATPKKRGGVGRSFQDGSFLIDCNTPFACRVAAVRRPDLPARHLPATAPVEPPRRVLPKVANDMPLPRARARGGGGCAWARPGARTVAPRMHARRRLSGHPPQDPPLARQAPSELPKQPQHALWHQRLVQDRLHGAGQAPRH